MQRYRLIKCFISMFHFRVLHEIARVQEVSVSSLVRDALTQYVQDLEEWEDLLNHRALRRAQAEARRERAEK